MGEEERCDTCSEHSGVKTHQTLVLWLLGTLIGLMITLVGLIGIQSRSMASIDKQVSIIPIQLQYLADGQESLKSDMVNLSDRVDTLEGVAAGIAKRQKVKPKVVKEKPWWK